MCSVYQNAYITIAAAKAENGLAGLFSDIHPDYQGHKVATLGGVHDVYFRRALDHAALQYFNPDRSLSSYPLLHRGWVYQERFLSTRFLYFGASELILECLDNTVSQCGDGNLASRPKNQERKAMHSNALKAPAMSSWSVWQHMVMDFSKLALSFPSDCFPALSGLAKQWQERTRCPYVAGMWRTSLVNDLQWTVAQGKQKARPKTWRAPSWSWASVDSEVRYAIPPVAMMEDAATVVEVKCTPLPIRGSAPDDTGQLESAFIVLSSLVIPATLSASGGNYTLRGGPGSVLQFTPDCAPIPGFGKASTMNVSLLRVGANRFNPNSETMFLLVLRQTSAPKETFERIGMCMYSWSTPVSGKGGKAAIPGNERRVTIV